MNTDGENLPEVVCICGHDALDHMHHDECEKCDCSRYIEPQWVKEIAEDMNITVTEVFDMPAMEESVGSFEDIERKLG